MSTVLGLLPAVHAMHSYNLLQVVSVLLVTGGVTLSTLAARHDAGSGLGLSKEMYSQYLVGISLLLLSLVVSGFMGLWQEGTFKRYGKASYKEALFYTHTLSLPLFLLFGRSLWQDVDNAWHMPAFSLPLLCNALTQVVCIAGVNRLTTRVSSVAVTLTLAVRKAASLAVSIAWAHARGAAIPNQLYLWSGTTMVLAGTVGYAHASSAAGSRGSHQDTLDKSKPDTRKDSSLPPTRHDKATSTSLAHNALPNIRSRVPQ